MKAVLVAVVSLLLLTTTAFADGRSGAVDCQSSPGNLICRNMADIRTAFGYTCTGSACYGVWRDQLHAMNRFVQNYNVYITYAPEASVQMGELAQATTRRVCGQKAEGACEWMKSLFHSKSAAIERLVEIQQGAKLASISKCSVNYHCP